MDALAAAIKALEKAKQELEKIGTVLSWELVAVNRSSFQVPKAEKKIAIFQERNCTLGRFQEMTAPCTLN